MSWPAALILPSGVKDPSNDYYHYIKEIEAKKSKRVVDSYPLPAKYNFLWSESAEKVAQDSNPLTLSYLFSPTCRICRTTKMPRWGRMWDLWGKVFSSDGKAWANRWRQPPLSWRTFRPRRVRQKPVPDGHCPHPPRKRKCPGRRCQTPKLSHQQCCGIACEICQIGVSYGHTRLHLKSHYVPAHHGSPGSIRRHNRRQRIHHRKY